MGTVIECMMPYQKHGALRRKRVAATRVVIDIESAQQTKGGMI